MNNLKKSISTAINIKICLRPSSLTRFKKHINSSIHCFIYVLIRSSNFSMFEKHFEALYNTLTLPCLFVGGLELHWVRSGSSRLPQVFKIGDGQNKMILWNF